MSSRAASPRCKQVDTERLEVALLPSNDLLAVDLGTATTQVFLRGEGVVAQEPTVVALDPRGKKVLAIGRHARESHDGAQIVQPLKDGTVADPSLTAAFLSSMIRPFAGSRMSRFSLVLTVPSSATPMERRVLREAGKRAG